MANETKGITVKIDAELHAEIKKYIEENNMTMAEFITRAVDDELHPKYNAQEDNKVEKMRTLAFQVPEDLFQRIKGYLARTGMSQKNFVIGLIEEELDRDEEMRAAENTTVAQDEDTPEESDDIDAGDIGDETEDESETYGEGPEDPIYMEGNSESEMEESGEDVPVYDTGESGDPAYLEDGDDAYDADASDEEAYDDAGYDEDEETDDYEEDDEEYDSEEVDGEYDDEESEDEDFDEEGDSEEYDEDEDSEEYDEEEDSEEYGEDEYDDEYDEDEEEEEESQSFVMSM